MKQVIDKNGDVVYGLYRSENGSLIVKESVQLQKAKIELNMKQDIEKLKYEVNGLRNIVNELLTHVMTRRKNGKYNV